MVEVNQVLIWIWIRQNDADPSDQDLDPQHCITKSFTELVPDFDKTRVSKDLRIVSRV